MNTKAKPETGNSGKIKPNTKKPNHKGKKTESSMLKKSELSLILLGASLLTLIVFFIFFKPSVNKSSDHPENTANIQALEKRIAGIEEFIHTNKAHILSDSSITSGHSPSMDSYQIRVARVEAALSVKFDALTKKLDTMNKKIINLSKQINHKAKANKTASKKTIKKIKAIKHIPREKSRTKKQRSIFHTVKKGDTLYSISKKYNIKLGRLRELNKLSKKSIIHPGDTMLIK